MINNHLSTEMITCIKEENPERLFNDYDFGGYLIANDIKVFIDGRADMYSNNIFADYLDLSSLNSDPEVILNKYDFDLFILAKKTPIYYYLVNNSSYESLIEDDNAIVMKKNN